MFYKLRFFSNMCVFSLVHFINLSNFTCFLSDPWNSIVLISWALNIPECSPSLPNGPRKKCFHSLARQLEQSLNTIYSCRIRYWKQLIFFTVSERAKLWYYKWLLRSDKWVSKCSIMIITRGCILVLNYYAHFVEMGENIPESPTGFSSQPEPSLGFGNDAFMNFKFHISRMVLRRDDVADVDWWKVLKKKLKMQESLILKCITATALQLQVVTVILQNLRSLNSS